MRRELRYGMSVLLVALVVGCSAPSRSSLPASSGGQEASTAATPAAPAAPKRITIGAFVVATNILDNRARPVPELVVGALTQLDNQGVRQPQLAEAVPSLENGLWQVFADGTMRTTHRLREKVLWHDGRPMTSDDLLFTATVAGDRSLNLAVRSP